MANNYDTTTSFKVDISDLKAAMQDAKRAVAVANSEFKAAASTCDDWTKSSDGLKAKLKQLDTTLKSQKTILKGLEAQYEAVVAEQGEGSKAADDLKIKINNQKAAINKTERELSKYGEALEEVSDAEKTAAKTGKDVTEVLEDMGKEAEDAGDGFTVLKGAVATFAGNAMSSLVGGIKDGISSMIGLADETREYRTELGKLETAFTTAGFTTEAATDTYKELYAVLGDEGQTVEAANMLAKLCDTEEELAEWTNIAAGVYGTFGSSLPIEGLAEAANETAKTGALTGSLADALNWAGVSEDDFQASLDACTTEQERNALITQTLNGLYSEAADAYKENNKSIMDANRANSDYADTMAEMGAKIEPVMTTVKEGFNSLLQEGLKLIEGVDMTAFSATIEEAFKVLTDTVIPAVKEGLGWIIDNKDVLVAGLAAIAAGFVAFKVASLIQSVTTAMQGMSVAQAALNLVMSMNPIGLVVAAIAGLVAAFVVLWNKCDWFREFWLDLWEKVKSFCGTAIDAIVKFFTETVPEAIDNMVTFFSELPAKVQEWLLNTIEKVAEWAGNMVEKAKELGTTFLENVVQFFSELPYKLGYLLGQAIGQVIQWGIDLYTFATTKVPEFIDKMIEFFKTLPSKVWTWLVNTMTNIKTWGANAIAKAREVGTQFLNNVINFVKQLPSKVSEWLTSTLTKVTSWGSDLAKKGKEAATNLFDNIVNTIKELPSKLLDIGGDIVEGLWNGINNMSSWISGKISSFGEGVLGGIKDFFGIHSPSKVMADEVGKFIPEGLAVGIEKNAKTVLSSMRDLSVNAVGTAKDSISGGITGAGVVNNFYQNNYSPKSLSRLEIYRQSKNLLGYAGGM